MPNWGQTSMPINSPRKCTTYALQFREKRLADTLPIAPYRTLIEVLPGPDSDLTVDAHGNLVVTLGVG